jgi:hypothetical protein
MEREVVFLELCTILYSILYSMKSEDRKDDDQ